MRQISPVWQRETPKAGRPCHPGAAEPVETPGATLSRVRDTPRTGVPAQIPRQSRHRVLANQLRRGMLNSPVESAELQPVVCRQIRKHGNSSTHKKRPVDLQPLTTIQQNNFTPQPPHAGGPITLTVCVTPHPSTTSRQHYFHRTAPLYMERRIYFRSPHRGWYLATAPYRKGSTGDWSRDSGWRLIQVITLWPAASEFSTLC